MRYSVEPRDRIYVNEYGFLPFAKNMGKHLSNKNGHKRLDSAKKSATDAIKTASKIVIQKTAEATGDLIGKKVADKTTSASTELNSKKSPTKLQNNKMEAPKKRMHISRRKTTNYWWIKASTTI